MSARKENVVMNFKTMEQVDVPQGRQGKHKEIITKILADLDHIKVGTALKVPLAGLVEGKINVRSALNRATRKGQRNIATASDGDFLYIWKVEE